jgi:putative membrane protein
MRSLVALLLAAALSPLSPLAAQAAALSNTDSTYLQNAMQVQLGRYALATLAEKQAASPKVKSLAKSIATDAGHDTQTLTALAKQYGLQPPKGPDVRSSYHYSQLTGLHGSEFDQQFVQELQIEDGFAVDSHKTEAQSGNNDKLRSFAKQRAQTLTQEQKTLDTIKV